MLIIRNGNNVLKKKMPLNKLLTDKYNTFRDIGKKKNKKKFKIKNKKIFPKPQKKKKKKKRWYKRIK